MATAAELVAKALSYVGYLEKASNKNLDDFTANAGSKNWTMFGRDYDKYMGTSLNGQAWCAMFVSCMGILLGISDNDYYKFAYCPYGVTWYKNQSRFYKSPKVGDIIFFTNGTRANHTGIVTKVTSSRVYTVEGNTSSADGVVANGGCVAEKSYSLTYGKILGYGRPKYGTESTSTDRNGCPYAEPTTSVKKGSTGNGVRWVQWQLVELGLDIGPSGIDGDFGNDTDRAVRQFQANRGLKVDGSVGPATRPALKNALAELRAAQAAQANKTEVTEVNDMTEAEAKSIALQTMKDNFESLLNERDAMYYELSDVPSYYQNYVAELILSGAIGGDGTHTIAKRRSQIESVIVVIKYFHQLDPVYLEIGDCPGWMQESVQELIDSGAITGDGNYGLNKTYSQLVTAIIAMRYTKSKEGYYVPVDGETD